ncbi:SGNH/GDSL hydrolase family protein [Flavisolibacter ginsenosidimutans]
MLLKSATTTYVPPPERPYYLDRNKLFEAMPADSNAVVFLGNSLTQYFELAEFFPGVHVKNRGIHGDMMEKVLLRLSPIIASQPKKIFIELGINDIEQKVPKERLLDMYDRLLDTLKNTCPSTKLYVQSILPVADTSLYLPTSYCSPQMNKDIVFMNRQLRWLAQRKACRFIDLHDKFSLHNELNPAYSVDGVHLSGEAYVLWAKILRPYVEE